jgi:hypothetical protein
MLLPLLGVLVAALLAALVAWPACRLSSGVLALGLVFGLTLSVLGVALSVAPYPWTDLIVLVVALCGGLALGRVLPTAFLPIFLVLALGSVLDMLLVILQVGTAPVGPIPMWLRYVDVSLSLPGWRFEIGGADLLLVAAMAEHWRRRTSSLPLALAPVVVGLAVLAAPFELLVQLANLPLVPFLTAGLLASEGWYRVRRQRAAK